MDSCPLSGSIHWKWSLTQCLLQLRDLTVGSLYYPDHINIATGWGHHIVYMILVEFIVQREWSHIFVLAGVMELPTFLLAISTLYPKLRNDIVFATTFLATRIIFHIGLLASYIPKSTRLAAVGGSFLPAILFALAFPMHVMWFIGCIKGFIRRAKARHETAATATLPVPSAAPSENEKRLLQVLIHTGDSTNADVAGQSVSSSKPEVRVSKIYPPSAQSLPSTPVPHSPLRIITLSPSVRSRSISRSRSSSLSSPTPTSSPRTSTPSIRMYLSRPPMAPRRRSLVSAEREEALRRLGSAIAELAEEAIAASPTMQSAVAVGKEVARTYHVYRGRAIAGVRRRGLSLRDTTLGHDVFGAGLGADSAGGSPIEAY